MSTPANGYSQLQGLLLSLFYGTCLKMLSLYKEFSYEHRQEIVTIFIKEFKLIGFNYTTGISSNITIIELSKYASKHLPYLNNQPSLYVPFNYCKYIIQFL